MLLKNDCLMSWLSFRLLFLIVLNISTSESIMIGDSITDLKSGHSAGMPVVLMEYGYTENVEIYNDADLVIKNFSKLKDLI